MAASSSDSPITVANTLVSVLTVGVMAIGWWLRDLLREVRGRVTTAQFTDLSQHVESLEREKEESHRELAKKIEETQRAMHEEIEDQTDQLRNEVRREMDQLRDLFKSYHEENKGQLEGINRILLDRLPPRGMGGK